MDYIHIFNKSKMALTGQWVIILGNVLSAEYLGIQAMLLRHGAQLNFNYVYLPLASVKDH